MTGFYMKHNTGLKWVNGFRPRKVYQFGAKKYPTIQADKIFWDLILSMDQTFCN